MFFLLVRGHRSLHFQITLALKYLTLNYLVLNSLMLKGLELQLQR